MIREFKLEDVNPVADLKNKLWQFANMLRGDRIRSEEYYIVLFLLVLFKEKVNPVVKTDGNNEYLDISLPQIDFNSGIKNGQGQRIIELYVIFDLIQPILRRLSKNSIGDLSSLFNAIDEDILTDNFPEIFDDLLYKLSKSQGRIGGEFIQPQELSRFVCGLADLPKDAKVYNPFAGLASFGVFLQKEQEYYGQEINQTSWIIGSLRIMAYDRVGSTKFVLGDSLVNWNPFFDSYDLIVANPPFGMRLDNQINGKFGVIRTCEHFLIEKGVEDIGEKGKLIAVIPQGFLFRAGAEQQLRQFLIENDLLEMVISFPSGLLSNSAIPIAVIVINKRKKEKGVVRFIDAKDFVENSTNREKKLNDSGLISLILNNKKSDSIKIVSNEQIRDFDFNLNLPRYFQKQIEGVELRAIATVIRSTKKFEGQVGKLIRIRNLKEDKLDYKLDINSVEIDEMPRPAQKISESCILLATRWKSLKPTYFEYAGEPIFIIHDIIALKVDEKKADIRFLINELSEDYISEQIDAFNIGSIIPSIRKDDLLSFKILLPSLEDQRNKVKEALEELAEEKKKELLFFKKIHGLESEIIEQNTYLRHSLAGPSSNIKGSLSNIKRILAEKVILKMPELMELKVSDNHELTFRQYLEILERDIIKISDAVSRQLKVETDIESKPITPIELIGFFNRYVNELTDKTDLGFNIDFSFDKETFLDERGELRKTYIIGNLDLLYDLFNNLISNAKAHAFTVNGPHRIEIFVWINSDEENQNEISILFSNTGRPFPEDFTIDKFVRKGSKAGKNAGDGFGGWYINEIINKLNGSFDIIDEIGPEGLGDTDLATSFEINFPIIETDE